MPTPGVNLHNIITQELGGLRKKTGSIWSEVSRQPVEPSPQEKLNQFMNLPSEVRQQMVTQMGPDSYIQHVQSLLDSSPQLHESGLMDYFMQDVHMASPQLPAPGVETYNPSNLDSLIQGHLEEMGNNGGSA